MPDSPPSNPTDDAEEWIPPEVIPDRHIAPEFPVEAEPDAAAAPPAEPKRPTQSTKAPRPANKAPAKTESTPITRSSKAKRASRNTVKPRRKERYTLVTIASTFRTMVFTFAAAVIVATVFMSRTPNSLLPVRPVETLERVRQTAQSVSATNTAVPTLEWAKRIGIIAGHFGNERVPGVPDPGAVCEDGSEFTELQVTTGVAQRVVALLRAQGFEVDLLKEFDDKLQGYQAAAIVSLHADSCDPEYGSGFKNAYPLLRETIRDKDTHLAECIRANYAAMTGLDFLPNQITPNMTEYHAWNAIAQTTPADILELGLLYHDRPLLKDRQDLLAQAVYNGIMCFLAPTRLATQQAQPAATTPAPDGGAVVATPTLLIPTEALVVTPSSAP